MEDASVGVVDLFKRPTRDGFPRDLAYCKDGHNASVSLSQWRKCPGDKVTFKEKATYSICRNMTPSSMECLLPMSLNSSVTMTSAPLALANWHTVGFMVVK